VLVLGAISLATRRINLGEAERLEELLPALAQILLAPYLGEEEIRKVIEQTAERSSAREAPE
jgi:hypothetical protein